MDSPGTVLVAVSPEWAALTRTHYPDAVFGDLAKQIVGHRFAIGNLQVVQSIQSKLTAAGYTEVRDIEIDSGLWEAEARDSAGQRCGLDV